MLITHNKTWRNINHICLGFQSNKNDWREVMLKNASYWAKKAGARSFTIFDIEHTDYHKNPMPEITGYGQYCVYCYTTKSEGEYIIGAELACAAN